MKNGWLFPENPQGFQEQVSMFGQFFDDYTDIEIIDSRIKIKYEINDFISNRDALATVMELKEDIGLDDYMGLLDETIVELELSLYLLDEEWGRRVRERGRNGK